MNVEKKIVLCLQGVFAVAMAGCQSSDDALLTAIREKNVERVREILQTDDVDLEPPSGLHDVNKPLAYAAAYGNLEIVELLVKTGADLDGQVAYRDVPLIKAAEHGNDDIVDYLIKAGANVNVPNAFGMSPFIGFCAEGNLKRVKLARENGGKINASFEYSVGDDAGKKNFTPLQAAVAYDHQQIVEYLLSVGADASAKDWEGRTALEIATAKQHDDIVRVLRVYAAGKGEVAK